MLQHSNPGSRELALLADIVPAEVVFLAAHGASIQLRTDLCRPETNKQSRAAEDQGYPAEELHHLWQTVPSSEQKKNRFASVCPALSLSDDKASSSPSP